MREIKFRGLSAAHNRWLYGDLIHNRGRVYIADDSVAADDIRGHTDFEVVPNTVGQYTGCNDKGGKEIYEGDIVRFPIYCTYPRDKVMATITGAVEFVHGGFNALKQKAVNPILYSIAGVAPDCEVIGNIHQKTDRQ